MRVFGLCVFCGGAARAGLLGTCTWRKHTHTHAARELLRDGWQREERTAKRGARRSIRGPRVLLFALGIYIIYSFSAVWRRCDVVGWPGRRAVGMCEIGLGGGVHVCVLNDDDEVRVY